MINVKAHAVTRNVLVLYQIKCTGVRGGSLRTQWQIAAAAQPLTVAFLKTRTSVVTLQRVCVCVSDFTFI